MKIGVDYVGVSIGAIIFNEKGEVLMSKRSDTCRNECGCWEFPGGCLEFGETLADGVRREVREEHDIEIDIIEQLPTFDHMLPEESQHWAATTFLAKMKDGQVPKIMEPDKCVEIGFFALENIPEPQTVISRLGVEYYRKRNKT